MAVRGIDLSSTRTNRIRIEDEPKTASSRQSIVNDPSSTESADRDTRARVSALAPSPAGAEVVEDAPVDVEPMTLSLLGRLFGVPLVIIGSIVGGAVIVVFTFGAPAAQRDRSLETLLTALEAGTGEKSLGMLLPRDKQHWQTGLELTLRLSKKDEFTNEQLQEVAQRLAAMIRAELAKPTPTTTRGGTSLTRPSARHQRLGFLIRALGKTERPEAVEPLLEVLSHADEPLIVLAMAELGNMAQVAGVQRSVSHIVERVKTFATPEAQMVGCTVLSVLGKGTDSDVVEVLTSLLRSGEGEVGWSAALALARLGSAAGKSTLIDLLDRSFWESGQRFQTTSDKGVVLRYRMPEERIERHLVTAVDAASRLSDTDVWDMIERLREDPRPRVRSRATEILASRTQTDASLPAGTEN